MDTEKTATPSHWTFRQRAKNSILYFLMRIGLVAAQRLPIRGMLRLFGCIAPWLFQREARRARAHLRHALPEVDAIKTTRRMFVHFAESIWELSRLHQSVPELGTESRRVLDEALAEGKGAVVISGHVGNWEMLGQAIAAAGYPIATIATPFYDPRVTAWLQQWRTRRGLEIVWRGRNTGKSILRVLRSNSLMAFLIDQDTKTAGDYVPFFGRPAFTPTIPAALALRTGAPVIFCWHHRRAKRHEITIERLRFTPDGDTDRDVLRLTAVLTAHLEAIIRIAPEQWVWNHRRWRQTLRA
ncbi:MAG TPA: lysophospholipid acyltransferase family protein [Candidatus Binatia bacterium]